MHFLLILTMVSEVIRTAFQSFLAKLLNQKTVVKRIVLHEKQHFRKTFVPFVSKTASEIETKCEQESRNKRAESGKAHLVNTARSTVLQQP